MENKEQPIFDLTAYALLFSVALYFVSWFLPALEFKGIKGSHYIKVMEGWECVYMGILGMRIGHVETLGNFSFFCAGILMLERMWKEACIASGVSLILGLQTLSLFIAPVSFDEAGATQSTLTKLDLGFYLWMSSFIVIFVVCLLKFLSSYTATPNAEVNNPG